MAASYTWPLTLPQTVEKGYSESIGLNILRTPMDSGPAKLRRRSEKPSVLNVSFIMTTAQINILEAFVFEIIRGVSRFYFIHPRTGEQVETRIMPSQDGTYYSPSYRAPGYWGISLQLEILP